MGRLGLRRRAPRVRGALRAPRDRVRRARRRRDARAGRQGRGQAAGREGRRARRGVERRRGRDHRGSQAARRHDRLPADDQGRGRWWRPRDAPRRQRRRARERVRPRPRGGQAGVRRLTRADGAGRGIRASRRGSADRRRPRRRVGAGRARLHLPAPPSEGRRRVGESCFDPRAGARSRGLGCRAGQACGLPRRRDGRVSLRAQRAPVLVHGGQHPAAGRAPGHGDGHRRRSGQAPAPRRGRRSAGGRSATAKRPRDRSAPERRGPGARVRADARADLAVAPAGRPRRARRQRRRRGRRGAAAVRLDDRQDHRPRQHARGSDRAPAPGDRRHDGRDR